MENLYSLAMRTKPRPIIGPVMSFHGYDEISGEDTGARVEPRYVGVETRRGLQKPAAGERGDIAARLFGWHSLLVII
jgi:hypothetical protein